MLEHHYRELRLRGKNNTKRKLVLEFMDEKYDLLAEFIMSDLSQFRDEIEQELDAVLNGELDKSDIRGNRCHLAIFPYYVIVYDDLAEDGVGQWCQADMDDFLDIIEEWDQKSEELREREEQVS